MCEALELSMFNTYEGLVALIEHATRFLECRALPQRTVHLVILVLEEMLTNTIKYGYDDSDTHEIQVRLAVDNGAVRIRCVDDGHEFDPLASPEVHLGGPIETRPVGGLGIHLVRKCVDTIEYRRDAGKNVLAIRVGGSSR